MTPRPRTEAGKRLLDLVRAAVLDPAVATLLDPSGRRQLVSLVSVVLLESDILAIEAEAATLDRIAPDELRERIEALPKYRGKFSLDGTSRIVIAFPEDEWNAALAASPGEPATPEFYEDGQRIMPDDNIGLAGEPATPAPHRLDCDCPCHLRGSVPCRECAASRAGEPATVPPTGLRETVRLFVALAHPSSDLPGRYIVHGDDLARLRAALEASPVDALGVVLDKLQAVRRQVKRAIGHVKSGATHQALEELEDARAGIDIITNDHSREPSL